MGRPRSSRTDWSAVAVATLLLASQLSYAQAADSSRQTSGAVKESRIRLVPVTSAQVLQELQESADGTRLITHDRNYAPRLWDAKSLRLLRVLGGHKDLVRTSRISLDGKLIATLSDSEVHLWDARLANDYATVSVPKNDTFVSGTFSPDGGTFLMGTAKGLVVVVSTKNPHLSKSWQAHGGRIANLKFSDDSKSFFTASDDKLARGWTLATGQKIADYVGHSNKVRWVQVSRDGKTILTTASDGTAKVFESATGKMTASYEHIIGPRSVQTELMSALFVGVADEGVLVSGQTGLMTVYDRQTGKVLRELKGHTAYLREIRETLDHTKIATYGDDDQLILWDALTGAHLPFERDTSRLPTAGDFSPDGKFWWLGMMDGSISKYDLKTGEETNTVIGSVMNIRRFALSKDGRRLMITVPSGDPSPFSSTTSSFVYRTEDLGKPIRTVESSGTATLSSDGRSALILGDFGGGAIYNLDSVKGFWLDKVRRAAISGDGSRIIAWTDNGLFHVLNPATGKPLNVWEFPKSKVPIHFLSVSDDGKMIISGPDEKKEVRVWDADSGKILLTIDAPTGSSDQFVFSPSGKRIAAVEGTELILYTLGADPKRIVVDLPKRSEESFKDSSWYMFAHPVWSEDESRIALLSANRSGIFNASTGEMLIDLPETMNAIKVNRNLQMTRNGKHILACNGNQTVLWEVDTKKKLMTIQQRDRSTHASFTNDGKRILVLDATDGVTIYDRKPDASGEAVKLGGFVIQEDGSWLVLDPEGRYDASDPSNVTGASYILEWSGGLEALDVQRFKKQFYEPNLLAKILGLNKEALRPVPKLDELHLYPEIGITRSKTTPSELEIKLKDRDKGGVGKIQILVNGKLVQEAEDTNLVKFDTANAEAFLLPQTMLPPGRGNIVTVTASNEKGDLVSPPSHFDIGVPAGLKTPDVKLYGLFVGVSDYVGSSSDLISPSGDAQALSSALSEVGSRLLPGKMNISTMTTSGQDTKPTKENIKKWFAETAKVARSTDIVFVFFAGHGCDRIGDLSDYFFLTSECDPSELNATVATTAAISGKDLQGYLSKIPANKQVVVLDTCHSGAASKALITMSRSTSGDFQRAYESIRDATGTWMLAGSASDQLSYESANVEHGMLTYSLLEAIDKATTDGLRKGSGEDLFVDVEQWLKYAAVRVESLKNEVGIGGIQRPELKRASAAGSFDVGITNVDKRGKLGLRPPRPIVILGNFEQEQEDPAGIEKGVETAMKSSNSLKLWTEVNKHPNVYRIAGTYTTAGEELTVKVALQKFDSNGTRQTVQTFTVKGKKAEVAVLSETIKNEVEQKILELNKKPG